MRQGEPSRRFPVLLSRMSLVLPLWQCPRMEFFAYVTNNRTNNVTAFRISTEGALLLVPSTPSNPNPVLVDGVPGTLAISPDTKRLYVANSGTDAVTAYNIEAAGALTLIPQTADNPNPVSVKGADPAAMAITQNGKFLYVANSGAHTVAAFQIGVNGLLTWCRLQDPLPVRSPQAQAVRLPTPS